MDNWVKRKSGKISWQLLLVGLILVIVVGYAVSSLFRGEADNDKLLLVNSRQEAETNGGEQSLMEVLAPPVYNEALLVRSFNYVLSVKPVNAEATEADVDLTNGVIKYDEAYSNTDVVQTRYINKLKEEIILKGPGHPDSFEYEINTDDFVWEVDSGGNILLRQKEKEDWFQIREVNDNYVKATMINNASDLYPVLFRIPAPFMVEKEGNGEDQGEVRVKITKNKLILTPDKQWLESHNYPIVLDPTVERILPRNEVVVFGNEITEDFEPEMKLTRWGPEASVTLAYDPEGESGTQRVTDNQVSWESKEVLVNMYYQAPGEVTSSSGQKYRINSQGGMELDMVLKSQPKNNVFRYRLESQGLEFYYQPEISDEEAQADLDYYNSLRVESEVDSEYLEFLPRTLEEAKRKRRPEHIVGSYAVYYSQGEGDFSVLGGKNYKAGKAFHIYRPRVYDAQGQETWGELKIEPENNLLTITVDAAWLAAAEYPVVVDPNLGYEDGGKSFDCDANEITGSVFRTGPAAKAQTMTAYICDDNSGDLMEYGIYKDSNSSFVEETEVFTGVADCNGGLTPKWQQLDLLSSADLDSGVDYIFVGWNNAVSMCLMYDGGDPNQGHYVVESYDGSWPTSVSFSNNNNEYSIYITYTERARGVLIEGAVMRIEGGVMLME